MKERLALLAALMASAAPAAGAQDTVIVIRPEARSPDSTGLGTPPPEAVNRLIAAHNDSLTTRLTGSFTIPRGTSLSGPVALYRGTLRVAGTLSGRVWVVNGNLVVESGGTVTGDVVVTGGGIDVRPGARLQGNRQIWPQPAPVYRTREGLLAVREPTRTLGDLATVGANITTGTFRTSLSVGTGRTYNRIEGLPLELGPTVTREGLRDIYGRLDLRAIVRTAPDRTGQRDDFGYSGRIEFRFGESRRLRIGARYHSAIRPIEEQPLSSGESGWAAFLLQRDYRDYYDARGGGLWASYALTRSLSLETALQRDRERTVRANDPLTMFRNEAWRPNPLVDDGHYREWTAALRLDTRNDSLRPSSGWLVTARWQRGSSDDVAPLSLPLEIRDPIPPLDYHFERIWLDARRYARINPTIRAMLRVVGGGWIHGDPLPVQRRYALGGPDLLPGYGFRALTCAPPGLGDPAMTAYCDRLLAVQLEVRTRVGVGLPFRVSNPYLTAIERLLGIEPPDLVFFTDAGSAWLAGSGPGRVPSDRLPVLREWKADFGVGLDAGGIGIYVARALRDDRPIQLFARLQRRF